MRSALALIAAAWMLLGPAAPAHAAEDSLTVEPDRREIPEDESLSVRFTLNSSMQVPFLGIDPEFDAPDFEIVNRYQSTQMQTVYENGRFEVQNTLVVTLVLRPQKAGDLKIRNIRVKASGRTYSSPDLTIRVTGAGQGAQPRALPPGSGTGIGGLRGGGRPAAGEPFFLRAEPSKSEVIKGEQLIVSYYVYRRVRLLNIQVTKYPILKGFLREDIDLPVVRGRLEWENVVSGGAQYQRALLARYAAYPLQEGELKIDQMAIKANFYPEPGSARGDTDDDMFMQFFQQLTPRTREVKSEYASVNVKPLPQTGKPAAFTGAVGDFAVISAVDRYQVRANEPVTLTVKIEGKGNVGAFVEPKAPWPEGVDLYESKGRATGGAGYSQKLFEFLLIPRRPGRVRLPPLDFSYFDPVKGEYVTKSTQAVDLEVLAPAPGSALQEPRSSLPSADSASPQPDGADAADLRYLVPPGGFGGPWRSAPWGMFVFFGGLAACGLVVVWAAGARARERRGALRKEGKDRQQRAAQWAALESRAAGLSSPTEVSRFYEALEGALLNSLSDVFGSRVRALSRRELGEHLVTEGGLPPRVWTRVEKVLEQAEAVRFGASGGDAPRSQAPGWAREAREAARELSANGGATAEPSP
ncbi:MAG: protein BatD [Bdellovibrionales bacterium]|nr:protein BatD [Bdellovibrionales bacterium]